MKKVTKMDIKSSLSCLSEVLKDTEIEVNIIGNGEFQLNWKTIQLQTDLSGATKAIEAFKTLSSLNCWD